MIRHTALDLLTTLLGPFAAAWDQEFGPRPVRTPTHCGGCLKEIVTVAPAEEVPAVSDAGIPASPPETLYVRRGEGRGARYLVAGVDATGTRYRRLVRGKKSKFEPVR